MRNEEETFLDSEAAEHFVASPGGSVQLRATRCSQCDRAWFPARRVCGSCGSTEVAHFMAGPSATVYASTLVRVGAQGFEAPYGLSYLDLDDLRVLTHARAAVGGEPTLLSPGTDVRLCADLVGSGSPKVTYIAVPVDSTPHISEEALDA